MDIFIADKNDGGNKKVRKPKRQSLFCGRKELRIVQDKRKKSFILFGIWNRAPDLYIKRIPFAEELRWMLVEKVFHSTISMRHTHTNTCRKKCDKNEYKSTSHTGRGCRQTVVQMCVGLTFVDADPEQRFFYQHELILK